MKSRLSPALLVVFGATLAGPVFAQDGPAAPSPVIAAETDALSFVTWAGATVRAAPDGASARVASLPFGAQVVVTGTLVDSDWVRVELSDGQTGYMWREVLAPMRVTLPGTAATPEMAVPGTAPAPTDLGALSSSPAVSEGLVSDSMPARVTFRLDQWSDVYIDLDGLSADVDISVLDSDGVSVGSGANAGIEAEYIEMTLAPGTYKIELTGYEGATSSYRLSARADATVPPPEDTAGNDVSTAYEIGTFAGGPVSLQEWVGRADSDDYFGFTLASRTEITIRLDRLDGDADLALVDENYETLASSVNSGVDADQIAVALDPGRYYVSVSAVATRTNYELTISGTGAAPAPEDRAGNDAAGAMTLGSIGVSPVSLSEWVGISDPNDYFAFTVERAMDVTIVMTPEMTDADLDLFRAGETEALAVGQNLGTEPERLNRRLDAGDYVLRAYAFQGDTPYVLEVSASPAP